MDNVICQMKWLFEEMKSEKYFRVVIMEENKAMDYRIKQGRLRRKINGISGVQEVFCLQTRMDYTSLLMEEYRNRMDVSEYESKYKELIETEKEVKMREYIRHKEQEEVLSMNIVAEIKYHILAYI